MNWNQATWTSGFLSTKSSKVLARIFFISVKMFVMFVVICAWFCACLLQKGSMSEGSLVSNLMNRFWLILLTFSSIIAFVCLNCIRELKISWHCARIFLTKMSIREVSLARGLRPVSLC